MPFEADCLAPFLTRLHQARRCYVAYSGGLDSHVLLHSTVRLLGKDQVSAIHINHQLSAKAPEWEQHCREQCELLGVSLQSEKVVVEKAGQGIEKAARDARYRIFESILKQGDLLLMAHHADDQVETVLYRLMRGSGVKGLRGIPQQRSLGQGELLRPLLHYRRNDLEDYAHGEKLCWIEDESNFAIDFDRNFLRHQVVPALAGRWQDYANRVSHSAALCNDADRLLDEVAKHDLESLLEREERLGWSVTLPELLDLSLPRRASLLRYWADSRGLSLPGHKALQAIESELLPAREDAAPQVNWGNAQLRRFRERVYLLPESLPDGFEINQQPRQLGPIHWQPGTELILPLGKVAAQRLPSLGHHPVLKIEDEQKVLVVFRQGGERCNPIGRGGSNTLKKLLQEASVEPWLRAYIPLIYIDDELAAVADLWICEGFEAAAGESGWQLEWCI